MMSDRLLLERPRSCKQCATATQKTKGARTTETEKNEKHRIGS
jgi:hypothetical protein